MICISRSTVDGRRLTVKNHLHIVCLDVPYPVDYGGVFDLFYKIKSLSEEGIKIHLHCFDYGRGQQAELNKYCVEVNYYHRLTGYKGISASLPYIVASRANTALLNNLKKDDYPILLEGIHCTFFLNSGDLKNKKVFVRLHNVEHLYYQQLYRTSSSLLKKIYYKRESKLLKKYEASLKGKATFWTVNEKDINIFINDFKYTHIENIFPFLPEYETTWDGEKGNYCLYHGNLSVPENEKAVQWLLENIFQEIEIPLVIAGKNPSDYMQKLINIKNNIVLVKNPDNAEMQNLIKKAQVNILPSFNNTGIKLKLINALFNGKHCLVNSATIEGTGLAPFCNIANDKEEMKTALLKLYSEPFTLQQFQQRIQYISNKFNNKDAAKKIIQEIFG